MPQKTETLTKQADQARNNGETAKAIKLYQQLFAEFEQAGNHERAGWALQMIGVSYKIDNATEESLTDLQQAASYFKKHGLDQGLGNTLRDIGITYEYAGELEMAKQYLKQGLTVSETSGDRIGAAITKAKLGLVETRQGQYQEAEQFIKEAIETLDAAGSNQWFYRSTAHWHLAGLYTEMGRAKDTTRELTLARKLIPSSEKKAQERRLAQFDGLLAYCLAKEGRSDEAIKALARSFRILLSGQMKASATAVVLRDIKANETIRILSQIEY